MVLGLFNLSKRRARQPAKFGFCRSRATLRQVPDDRNKDNDNPFFPDQVSIGLAKPSSDRQVIPELRAASDASGINMQRKIWVKRPGASPTRVTVHEDDLVDNVRDVILGKYSNSLGKSIDSPDITLKICSREQSNKGISAERILGPEEPIGRTLDAYYPGGQAIEEALIIEVPQRRTPRPSPRVGNHHLPYYIPEEYRPGDTAREYFPPMTSPHLNSQSHSNNSHHPSAHSMSVLATGQLPPLPSPGAHSSRRHGRPKYGRQHTSSPTIMHNIQPNGNNIESKVHVNGINAPSAAPMPTPPANQGPLDQHKPSLTPPNRTLSPHPGQGRTRRNKTSKQLNNTTGTRSMNGDPPPPPKPISNGLVDNTVPPINVLIVEDNIINLKLLEMFMKRLKVRWKTAMNGKEAVAMWRTGGFHLVLMDIQLPVMNGLEATKEIRRVEGVNGIGVFSGSPIDGGQPQPQTSNDISGDTVMSGDKGEDDLGDVRSLFKSPVIIVALTASSLQSDRHEALAAGCNDFLTKPVNFTWMERKVTEWGCMQALIDFDGWRKWKQYAADKEEESRRMDPREKERLEAEEKRKAKEKLKAMFAKKPPTLTKGEEKAAPPAANGGTAGSEASAKKIQYTTKVSKGTSRGGIGQLDATPEGDEDGA